jgi:uncharacterized OB-fold protein
MSTGRGLTLGSFREALGRGEIAVSQCANCGTQQAIPSATCFNCGSTRLEVQRHSGAGRIFSWVVCHYPFADDLREEVPYTVVLVELEGGGRIYGRLEPPFVPEAPLPA